MVLGTLSIERTQERDHGKYECVAENEVGVAYSSAAMLYVKSKFISRQKMIIYVIIVWTEKNVLKKLETLNKS